MNKVIYRQGQILLAGLSFFILISSFYFQYVKNLQPCPLCLMQRLCVFLLFILGLIGIYAERIKPRKIIAVLQIIFALGGVFFAGRQLWLQALPAGQAPACMPDLGVLVRYFPWSDVLHALFWGAGDCAEVNWTWLGLSMPAWSAFYFLFMLVAAIFIIRRVET
ncbi:MULTISPECIES: disulfide bond formation protein B [unclassified Legionella]|uniref:disulfide bond formation protein B n=1 Tax=unclassified Legionella TaxID=2622702 RepID=UPI001E546928|nr:disulfide bond formation protein B [Legionella sp. 31fI33]MCC5013475.1 disulfide bond formation protein B [Legionella sp. 31fI33]